MGSKGSPAPKDGAKGFMNAGPRICPFANLQTLRKFSKNSINEDRRNIKKFDNRNLMKTYAFSCPVFSVRENPDMINRGLQDSGFGPMRSFLVDHTYTYDRT
jgi:hypothetical protein